MSAYRGSGSTTEQFVAAVSGTSLVNLAALLDDWLLTASWAERIRAGESLENLVEGYRRE